MEICCWEFLWKYFLFKVNKVSDAIVCTRARRMWPGSLLSRTYNRPLSSELVVLLLSRVVVGISNLGSLTPEWAAVFPGNPKTSFHVVGWWVLNWWILPGFFVGSGYFSCQSPRCSACKNNVALVNALSCTLCYVAAAIRTVFLCFSELCLVCWAIRWVVSHWRHWLVRCSAVLGMYRQTGHSRHSSKGETDMLGDLLVCQYCAGGIGKGYSWATCPTVGHRVQELLSLHVMSFGWIQMVVSWSCAW